MPARVDVRTAAERLRRFVPPVLADFVARSRSGWRYVGPAWPSPYQNGWHDESVAEAQRRHWPFLVDATSGSGPLGLSHFPWRTTVDEPADQNIVASFGYVLALTALTAGEPISLLDWGGGLGHYRLYAKALLPRVAIDYHCVDLPGIAAAGRTLQPDAQFHTSAREIGDRAFDLVVCSSALHYAQDWPATLALLAKATTRFLYVARLQTVERSGSFVVEQSPHVYRRPYVSWFLNRREFIEQATACALRLEREFVYDERWFVRGAPEQGRSWGFLLSRIEPSSRALE
jgi:putative methyltransferase (TIGR04325 family)